MLLDSDKQVKQATEEASYLTYDFIRNRLNFACAPVSNNLTDYLIRIEPGLVVRLQEDRVKIYRRGYCMFGISQGLSQINSDYELIRVYRISKIN